MNTIAIGSSNSMITVAAQQRDAVVSSLASTCMEFKEGDGVAAIAGRLAGASPPLQLSPTWQLFRNASSRQRVGWKKGWLCCRCLNLRCVRAREKGGSSGSGGCRAERGDVTLQLLYQTSRWWRERGSCGGRGVVNLLQMWLRSNDLSSVYLSLLLAHIKSRNVIV